MRQEHGAVVPAEQDVLRPDSMHVTAARTAAASDNQQNQRAAHPRAFGRSGTASPSWALEERVGAIRNEGFTERQAAFLVTVMLHAGVCMVRQYCAFAGIKHGHNAREFFSRLVERRIATPYAALHARARLYHIHHRRLYTAIGEPNSRFRKPLPAGRAMERLMILDAILDQPAIPWLATEGDKWAHFIRTFGTALTIEWLPQLRFGTPPHVTVRYFPDRQPIGIVEAGEAYTFLYLATNPRQWTCMRSCNGMPSCSAPSADGRCACCCRRTCSRRVSPSSGRCAWSSVRGWHPTCPTSSDGGVARERQALRPGRRGTPIGGRGHRGPFRLPGIGRSISRGACWATTSLTALSLPSSRTRWSAAPDASSARC